MTDFIAVSSIFLAGMGLGTVSAAIGIACYRHRRDRYLQHGPRGRSKGVDLDKLSDDERRRLLDGE
jgi:hypothetical protein